MNRSFRTLLLGATLCVLPLSACLCGEPPTDDAGPGDAGEGEGEGECDFVGVSCDVDDDCCGTLACTDDGVCGQPPACTDNDTIAGTTTAPADLDAINATDEMHACNDELANVDVFEVTAEEGELLKIVLTTVGSDPAGQVGGGEADIDLFVFGSVPTAIEAAGQGFVPTGGELLSGETGATLNATERVLFTAPAAGTYYVVVSLYAGPEGDYNLSFGRGWSCESDADCPTGFDFCRVDVDLEVLSVLQQCSNWTTPSCGQGTEEGGGDVHSDADAVAITGEVTGTMCQADIDVFSFEKEAGVAASIDVAFTTTGTDLLITTIVDPAGEQFDVAVANAENNETSTLLAPGARTGTWLVYISQFDPTGATPNTDDSTYTIDVTTQSGCRTDADCETGEGCGISLLNSGLFQVCAPTVATACGETDGDNSMSEATLLASGMAESASNCMGALDWYRVPLDGAVNNVTVDMTWKGTADVDLYVLLADGTRLGAGWYGTGGEQWVGNSLAQGELFVAVDVYSCAEGAACETSFDYSITATVQSGAPCATQTACLVGGTASAGDAEDPTTQLACLDTVVGGDVDAGPADAGYDAGPADAGYDAGAAMDAGVTDAGATDGGAMDAGPMDAGYDSGPAATDAGPTDAGPAAATLKLCVRPTPSSNFGKALGDACFAPSDCSGLFCLNDLCSAECAADGECSALGTGAYCSEASTPNICLAACSDTADCQAVFGADTGLVCFEGECSVPN